MPIALARTKLLKGQLPFLDALLSTVATGSDGSDVEEA